VAAGQLVGDWGACAATGPETVASVTTPHIPRRDAPFDLDEEPRYSRGLRPLDL